MPQRKPHRRVKERTEAFLAAGGWKNIVLPLEGVKVKELRREMGERTGCITLKGKWSYNV